MSSEPIDAVITWVDSADPKWQRIKAENPGLGQWETAKDESMDADKDPRFRDFGLLQYSVASILKYAPWIRNIFVVTMQQQLNFGYDSSKVKLIYHQQFIPKKYLPTFNSNTIEMNIHRIPGLAEHFILFNDDTLLGKMTKPEDFFYRGLPRDVYGLKPIDPDYGSVGAIDNNNVAIINKYFPKKKTWHRHLSKSFSLKNGISTLLQTILCLPWRQYIGFKNFHVPIAHRKSDFSWVWHVEGDLLDRTCQEKYRSGNDVSHWVLRYMRLVKGEFVPYSPKNFKYYDLASINIDELANDLTQQRHKLLCINDVPNIDRDRIVPAVTRLLEKHFG